MFSLTGNVLTLFQGFLEHMETLLFQKEVEVPLMS